MSKYTIGLDFGTLSARAVVVNTSDGRVMASAESPYAHGVISSAMQDGTPLPDSWALQDPHDYLEALEKVASEAMRLSGIAAQNVIGLGVDFTGSTTLPVLKDGTPLCFLPQYAMNPHAYVKLWKHHGAQKQANEMTRVAVERNEPWLAAYGGRVSSEWALPKLWQLLEEAPDIYAVMDEWIEAGDWMVWQLTGARTWAAGCASYKSLYSKHRGYPDEAYFAALDERLRHVIAEKYPTPAAPNGSKAGGLCAEMAEKLGLIPGIAVSVSNLDGHVCGPAANVTRPGQMLAIIGTSTGVHSLCDGDLLPVKGMCGAVEDGMVPGLISYESGQSCVGDLFAWFAENCVPPRYYEEAKRQKISVHEHLTRLVQQAHVGESGLLVLDWWNGNRSILADSDLGGMIIGMTLQTRPEEIYRALIEATAFGMRAIVDNHRAYGVPVEEIVAAGGISQKNALVMQIYADVLNMPIHVSDAMQGPALGSAIFGAAAAGKSKGGYDDLLTAAEHMHASARGVYLPDHGRTGLYNALYQEYCILQGYFAQGGNDIMKRLLQRKAGYSKIG